MLLIQISKIYILFDVLFIYFNVSEQIIVATECDIKTILFLT